jgi:hypothetical protein
MMKRSVFLSLAAGLVASLAFVTPSHAEFITSVSLTNNTPVAVGDLETTWSGTGGSIIDVVVTTPAGSSSSVVGGNTIDITFPGVNSLAVGGSVAFTFESATAPTFVSGTWSLDIGGTEFFTTVVPRRDDLVVTSQTVAVPEPSAMALLGIGMAGFFTYRRLFKRPATA